MPEDSEDDVLLAELAEVLGRVAGPPAELLALSRELYTWRTVDAELAELAHDSLAADLQIAESQIDESQTHESQTDDMAVGVRAGQQPRTLSFETDSLLIEVELDDTVGARRLIGQLVPAGPARLELRSPDGGTRSGSADELGRFVLELPARHGPVSIRCTLPDGAVVETPWESL